ncbi:V-type proton ATPase 16 kDa proteolipid subunit [Butyriboletus roseoflavus]|nr:V-type proton ATPase 16 kDa proteolipid subunit [Butyriboletus roseoflavus]
MGVLRPDLVMRCVIPVIMAGIIAVCAPFVLLGMLTMSTMYTDLRPGCFGPYLKLTFVHHCTCSVMLINFCVIVGSSVSLAASFIDLGAGLSVGLAGLAAGFAIGIVGDAGVRGTAQQPRLYVGMVLILIFAEVLGLYGLIVALIMHTRAGEIIGC